MFLYADKTEFYLTNYYFNYAVTNFLDSLQYWSSDLFIFYNTALAKYFPPAFNSTEYELHAVDAKLGLTPVRNVGWSHWEYITSPS